MLVVDEFASIKDALRSTVDFTFNLFVSRLMPGSHCKMGANRTLMLLIVREPSGSPVECAHPVVTGFWSQHSFIGFSCGIFLLCLF